MSEQHAGEARPMMERSPFDGSTPEAVELWDAINRYASGTRLSVQRQIAVAEISSLIRAAWNRRAPSPHPQHAGEHSPEPWTKAQRDAARALGVHFALKTWDLEEACAEIAKVVPAFARAPALQAENARLRDALEKTAERAESECARHSPAAGIILANLAWVARSALRESGVGK